SLEIGLPRLGANGQRIKCYGHRVVRIQVSPLHVHVVPLWISGVLAERADKLWVDRGTRRSCWRCRSDGDHRHGPGGTLHDGAACWAQPTCLRVAGGHAGAPSGVAVEEKVNRIVADSTGFVKTKPPIGKELVSDAGHAGCRSAAPSGRPDRPPAR